jgi:hypothetical protein
MAKELKYRMDCRAGYYEANSYFGLGLIILKHRLWHLYKHKRFMD